MISDAFIADLPTPSVGADAIAISEEPALQELAEDLRAFSVFAANPKVRQSVEAAEGFFQALQLRRPEAEEEARQGSDPATSH